MKRFFQKAEPVQRTGGHGITLDTKPIKTPGKRDLVVPNGALAAAIAEEWNAGDEIVVSRMDHDANVTPWTLAAAAGPRTRR